MWTKFRVMIRLNMHEAKTHLSRYVSQLEGGRDDPPLPPERSPSRRSVRCRRRDAQEAPTRSGCDRGRFTVPDSFFEPLPDEVHRSPSENGPVDPRACEAPPGHLHLPLVVPEGSAESYPSDHSIASFPTLRTTVCLRERGHRPGRSPIKYGLGKIAAATAPPDALRSRRGARRYAFESLPIDEASAAPTAAAAALAPGPLRPPPDLPGDRARHDAPDAGPSRSLSTRCGSRGEAPNDRAPVRSGEDHAEPTTPLWVLDDGHGLDVDGSARLGRRQRRPPSASLRARWPSTRGPDGEEHPGTSPDPA